MELTVYNIEGKDTGRKVNLNDEIFGIEPNDHAIYLDVKRHMANKRQGTHKAKERSEVRGSTRKIKKQKGTGSARAGSMKNPLFRGGGRVFGPRPRDYSFKLNKKVKKLARKSALTYKLKANELFIVEDFTFDAPKTKQYVDFEKNLKINDKKSILVLAEPNKNLYLSSRNLKGSKTITVSELTTYDILNTKALVLSESSVDVLEKTF
jgi:large subunit ribosomal protein L4